MIARGLTRKAAAQDYKPGVIRLLGQAPTLMPGDWSQFESDTRLKMEFTVLKDDPSVFFNEVMVNEAGARYDIISTLAGLQGQLADGGWILPLDTSRLSNWEGVPESLKKNPLLVREDGTWGLPMYMNADTFGYLPEALNEPRPPQEVSWGLIFDSEKTLGKVGLGDNLYSLMFAAGYMKYHKLADIKEIANMTASEVETVASWLIERKKAGQFRTFWSTFDDQITNFVNGEVTAQVCWEPAVKESRKQGVDVEYAWTPEFYVKWIGAAFIPVQAEKNGNLDEIYKAFEWFLSGAYGGLLGPLRGYTNARPDLALEWARERNLEPEKIKVIEENIDKIFKKYASEEFWFHTVPDTIKEHERQMARFLNA
jgi:spermidine/putrescine-binding protein